MVKGRSIDRGTPFLTFVLSHDGVMTGVLVGRECLPDAILYCSKESHYSVLKAARMYRMEVANLISLYFNLIADYGSVSALHRRSL